MDLAPGDGSVLPWTLLSPNGFAMSRERREPLLSVHRTKARRFSAPSQLCRLWVRDFQVTTDLDDEEVVDLVVPRNR